MKKHNSSNLVRVLLIEDDPDDIVLVKECLNEINSSFEFDINIAVEHVECLSSGIDLCDEKNFDVILLDLTLPDATGTELVRLIRAQNTEIPIITISSSENEYLAIETVQKGGQDYICKGDLTSQLLFQTITRSIERMKLNNRILDEMRNSVVEIVDFVGHEHNNLLTAVIGNLCLLKMEIGNNDRCLELLSTTENASERICEFNQSIHSLVKDHSEATEFSTIFKSIQEMVSSS